MKSNILGSGWLPYFNKLVEWGVHEDDAIFYLGVINSEYLGDFSYDEEDPFEDNEYLDWNDRESIINDLPLPVSPEIIILQCPSTHLNKKS